MAAEATPGLDAARRATVRVCGADGAHVGHGLLLTLPDGDVVVLTCHHVASRLGPEGVHVALRRPEGDFGPPIPAIYDWNRSHPDHDAAVLRLRADPAPGRPRPLLHALERPEEYVGSLRATGVAFHAQADVFGGRIEAGAQYLRVPARPGGLLPDAPARYVLPFVHRLVDVSDANEGTSGAVVLCEGGVLGLAHFARLETAAAAREGYVVPLTVWAEDWPALAGLIEHVPLGPVGPERALVEARRKLAALPTEAIPPPTPLPPGSHVPYQPNPLFVGREPELRALAGWLQEEGAAVAVTGLGGLGKTQLAVEFAHRYGHYFSGGVFWLSFADEAAVAGQVAACGGGGALALRPDFHALPAEEQTRLVRMAWQSPLPRLLVFDNCETEAALAQWRPTTGGCRLLVTSRRGAWSPTAALHPLALHPLARDAGVRLLGRYLGPAGATDAAVAAVADHLAGLPLALHLAGSFLAEYAHDVEPADYLRQLRGPEPLRPLRLADEDRASPTGHEQDVSRTFELSYGRLVVADPTDALARRLLARAALFAPGEPIPRDLLFATEPPADDASVGAPPGARALRRLVALGLLEDSGALRLHPLLAAFARNVADDPGDQAAVARALARGYEALRRQLPSGPARTIRMTELVRQVRGFARQATYTADALQALFTSGGGGARIVALGLLAALREADALDLACDGIRQSRSAFEQYQALAAAAPLVEKLDSGQQESLRSALLAQVGEGPGQYIRQGTDRYFLAMRLLATLSPPSAPSGVARLAARVAWIPDSPDERDHVYAPPALADLPTNVDLRPQLPPVHDQGQVAGATASALAVLVWFEAEQQGSDFEPSRRFIEYHARLLAGPTGDARGVRFRDGLKALARWGVCAEEAWPYSGEQVMPPPADSYANAARHRIGRYERLPQDLLAMKRCLASGHPFVFGFLAHESLEAREVSHTGTVPLPSQDEQIVDGLAVIVVGYDDVQRRCLVRLPWGSNWGMQGYGAMPYAYLTDPSLAGDFWTLRMPVP